MTKEALPILSFFQSKIFSFVQRRWTALFCSLALDVDVHLNGGNTLLSFYVAVVVCDWGSCKTPPKTQNLRFGRGEGYPISQFIPPPLRNVFPIGKSDSRDQPVSAVLARKRYLLMFTLFCLMNVIFLNLVSSLKTLKKSWAPPPGSACGVVLFEWWKGEGGVLSMTTMRMTSTVTIIKTAGWLTKAALLTKERGQNFRDSAVLSRNTRK